MIFKSTARNWIAVPLTAATLMIGPAMAQETATTPTAPAVVPDAPTVFTPPEGYSLLPDWTTVTADTLQGAEIMGPDGASIGKVSDVELGADGAASGIIADIGGFLGMGTHTVKLGADQISLYRNADGAIIAHSTLTKEALEALPEYTPPG